MSWRDEYRQKTMPATEAAQLLRVGDHLYTPIGGDTRTILPALFARVIDLDLKVKIHACAPRAQDWFGDEFATLGFDLNVEIFSGAVGRPALEALRADWYPQLFSTQFSHWDEREQTREPIDVFVANVTPPDDEGYVTFGGTPWHKGDFARRARVSLFEVCPWLPHVPTTERMHVSEISAFVMTEVEKTPLPRREPTAEAETIAGFVREIVQDGDTVQIGAGRSATYLAALRAFDGKHDLGWHSEITPGGVVPLMMDGTINGSRKSVDRGLHVTTTITARNDDEFEWLSNAPPVETRAVREVNAIPAIAAQERMTAINNAFQVDLTGQICSESLGTKVYNGTGGQPEFHIGAFIAPRGKAITVLPSAAGGGAITRVVPAIEDGSYVTVPRTFADYVVTEYGIARLNGRSQRQRARELIAVAHPDHRGELRRAMKTLFYPSGVRTALVE